MVHPGHERNPGVSFASSVQPRPPMIVNVNPGVRSAALTLDVVSRQPTAFVRGVVRRPGGRRISPPTRFRVYYLSSRGDFCWGFLGAAIGFAVRCPKQRSRRPETCRGSWVIPVPCASVFPSECDDWDSQTSEPVSAKQVAGLFE